MTPSRHRRHFRVASVFLLPNVLGFCLFTAWPVIAALLLSFCSWNLLTPPQWVGIDNYVELLGFHRELGQWVPNDPEFWHYLGNTLFFLLALPVNVAGSLILAMVLNEKIRGVRLYRLIFFLPSVLSGVAIFYLWRWMYNTDYGLVNTLLAKIGIVGPNWLGSVVWAKPALMLMGSWMAIGGTNMVLYLAALQHVSTELHEAAHIDGANAWHRFWVVTWPAVMPVTFFIVTMGLINGLQSGFDSAFVMTGGGPNGSTTTLGYYIYTKAYLRLEMGYASAVAWILFSLVLGTTIVNWRRSGQDLITR